MTNLREQFEQETGKSPENDYVLWLEKKLEQSKIGLIKRLGNWLALSGPGDWVYIVHRVGSIIRFFPNCNGWFDYQGSEMKIAKTVYFSGLIRDDKIKNRDEILAAAKAYFEEEK